MNQTTNMIFAFIGGMAVGALATVGVLKKIAKNDPKTVENVIFGPVEEEAPVKNSKSDKTGHPADDIPIKDTPSFDMGKTIDTHKVAYSALDEKPDLAEMAKKYANTTVEKEAAEREHPTEDDPEDEEEEYDEEAELENEIGESLMKHPGKMADITEEEIDGYGHVMGPLDNGRRSDVIYLIPEEHAGEIFPLECLTYYMRDDILADESDTPVDDVNRIIADALDYFGECGEDPDMVFVRNCSIGIEYEITRVDEFFGAKIYGVTQEEMAEVIKKGKKKPKKSEEK